VAALVQPSQCDVSDDDLEMMTSIFEKPDSTSCKTPRTLKEELEELQKMFDIGSKEKLKVDEDDILNNAITYYKSSDFNPSKRLRVVYQGQPACDTGGVVRQFFTQLLKAIFNAFFQGCEYRSPIHNCDTAASGIMRIVGTIIVHSILHGGPGLPVFSPAVYYYLTKGNPEEAMEGLSVIDCSLQMADFIKKVKCVESAT